MKKYLIVLTAIAAVIAMNSMATAMCLDTHVQCGYIDGRVGMDRCCPRETGCCGDRCCDKKSSVKPSPGQETQKGTYDPPEETQPSSGHKAKAEEDRRALANLQRQAQPLVAEWNSMNEELEKKNGSLEALRKRIRVLKDPELAVPIEDLVDKNLQKYQDKLDKVEDNIGKLEEERLELNLRDKEAVKKFNDKVRGLIGRKNNLEREIEQLNEVKNDPDLALRWREKKTKELENKEKEFLAAQEHLQNRINIQESKIAPYVQSMRDRCQDLANNSEIKDEDLAARCGSFFDGNQSSRPIIDRFGTTPIYLPPSRFQAGFQLNDPSTVPDPGPGHQVYPPGGEEDESNDQ